MFDDLEEQIHKDEGAPPPLTTRVLKYVGLFVLTLIVFGALYLAIRLLE